MDYQTVSPIILGTSVIAMLAGWLAFCFLMLRNIAERSRILPILAASPVMSGIWLFGGLVIGFATVGETGQGGPTASALYDWTYGIIPNLASNLSTIFAPKD